MTPQPVLDIRGMSVRFAARRRAFRAPTHGVRAVTDVDLTIGRGETVALVGESGSGKSTTGRGALRLVELHSGTVHVDGTDVTALPPRELRRFRRHMQMVFQDPYSSLDPSRTVAESVGEPLEVHEGLRGNALRQQVAGLFEKVSLQAQHLDRYPNEFSGGQRQRIAIARAIASNPKLIVCDEAVSALDVSTQNQVLQLIRELQADLGTSYLFIAHDLAVVRHIASRVAVMYLGRIVEEGPVERIFDHPAHPYTQALLSAVPIADPIRQRTRERIVLTGDMPDPTRPPSGCAFRTRCHHVMDVCHEQVPAASIVTGGGSAACHLHTSGPTLAGRSVKHLPVSASRFSAEPDSSESTS